MLKKEDKVWSIVGIILIICGMMGANRMISGILGGDCILTVDTFAIGIGVVLWRISAKD